MKRKRRPTDQTFGHRVGYRVDRFLALHPVWQLLAVLASATVLAIFFAFAVNTIDGAMCPTPAPSVGVTGVSGDLWWAITHMLDGGTVAGDSGPLRRVFGVGVTLVGAVLLAVITGAFASSFSQRLDGFRRGTLPVFEQGHVVFLGYNVHAGVVLRELADSGLGVTLVIVANRDREVIEDGVRELLEGRAHRLRIIARRGDPTTTASARRAAVGRARAVMILPEAPGSVVLPSSAGTRRVSLPDAFATAPASVTDTQPVHLADAITDRSALFSLLAVKRLLGTRRRPVIVDVATSRGDELVHLCDAGGHTIVVEGRGMNARLLAQCVRQQGVFGVARQILSLDARSVFFHAPEGFVGKTFDAAHAALEGGILVGIARAEVPILSPPGSLVIAKDDRLLVFSDGPGAPRATGTLPSVDAPPAHAPVTTLRVLVLRYRQDLPFILASLGDHCPAHATVMVSASDAPRVRTALAGAPFGRTEVVVIEGDPLDGAAVDSALADRPDVALLLAPDTAPSEMADADADQLITLLHIRRTGDAAPRVVVEFRSPETRRLTRPLAGREDFILKREVVGLLLAQELHAICRERAGAWVGPVYSALLSAIGPSIELHALSQYTKKDRASFAEIAAAARCRDEVAIGVAREGKPNLLPRRDERFDVAGARVVVLRTLPKAPCTA